MLILTIASVPHYRFCWHHNLYQLDFPWDPHQCFPLQTVKWTCSSVFLGLLIDVSHAESALLTRAPLRELVALKHAINSLSFSQLKWFLQELLLPWTSEIGMFIRMCHHRNERSLVSWICHYRSQGVAPRVFLFVLLCQVTSWRNGK